ncbi:2-dehydropantoate 2-reductase [Alphaproteobacteria bacterium]|jgi:2-dehydropantoate 2-reductase|nr:2-dehydropantoate 2-reductase [Alphaproteobacteria bacterium]
MKIAVIGAGAMGSIYASFLAQSNNDVLAIDLWEDHINAINTNGLRVSGFSGDKTVKNIKVSKDINDAKGYELFIIATKAAGVGPVASKLSKIVSKDSIILTIQNGLGAGERIASFMPSENILLGVAQGFGASMIGPGHAHHNNMSMIRIGEMNGGITQRLENLVQVWCDAGFNAKSFEDIEQLIWEKFVCNVAWSGSCSIFKKTLGQVMENEDMFNIAKGCALEARKMGDLRKVNFTFDDTVDYITEFGKKLLNSKPSMLQDVEAQRLSEIDAINGMVVTLGKEHNVETPYNTAVSSIIKAQEADY